ncbi:hypothetical protein EIP91_010665 [Steccherinum ochraceum]|uniref:Uncharacterized protein n=1 Tax=Steccherinum ochraceum TaxID=92696 RepID=A0A4R0RIS7_9APHY|nr:hypothetical protein EIP91_010665 [Steccherinum ochraceum]
MNPPPFRRGHRKRISALRLSSDSNATLPVYTSPPWQRPTELPGDISDRPPDYPDSSEEGDADIDSDEEGDDSAAPLKSSYTSPTPPLNCSPRRSPNPRSGSGVSRRSSTRRSHQSSSNNDPYLDSLLARSVHALELSNTLLQSSMSTQTSLSNVLASDSTADTTLETQAHNLSFRISGNDTLQDSILDDLKKISNGVEDLIAEEDLSSSSGGAISQSLPTSSSSLSARLQASHMRRPSLDFRTRGRSTTDSQLQLSTHDRRDLIAPAPRALTMYVDSTDDPSAIILPPTLGLRSSAALPPTPLPSESSFPRQDGHGQIPSASSSSSIPQTSPAAHEQQPKRALDVLSSYIVRRPSTRRSSTSTTTSSTVTGSLKRRRSKSPPPPIRTSPSMRTSPCIRGRSVTPARDNGSPSQRSRPLIPIPSIEELSASDSSSSDTMHVDRTLESLRTILEKQPPPPRPPSPARPSLLSPPTVAPTQSTSTATASVSRLFTKSRHSSSTRPPSPPRHSAMKGRSAPPTPTHTPSPSLSMLSVSDALISPFGFSSSGHSTPKRISFAEPPPSARPQSSRTLTKRSGSSRAKGKRKASSGPGGGDESSGSEGGWWMTWLLGAAGTTGSASGVGMGAARRGDERMVRSSNWNARPGFGSSLEDWAM